MERPWMPFYFADFFAKTYDLKASEIGCYTVLLGLAWMRQDGALPNDMKWLKQAMKAHIVDFHGHTFNAAVHGLLERYFTLGADNKWHNKRLRLEYDKWLKMSSNQSQKAFKRWHGKSNINKLVRAAAMPLQLDIERKRLTKEEIQSLKRLRVIEND